MLDNSSGIPNQSDLDALHEKEMAAIERDFKLIARLRPVLWAVMVFGLYALYVLISTAP
jgi:hypothetical protein